MLDTYNRKVVDAVERIANELEIPYGKAETKLVGAYQEEKLRYDDAYAAGNHPSQISNMASIEEIADRVIRSQVKKKDVDYRHAAMQRVHTRQNPPLKNTLNEWS